MTSIILTETHLYADQQVSTDRSTTHECRDCKSQNVLRVRQRECSKITVPSKMIMYRGSPILALAAAGNSRLIVQVTDLILSGICPIKTITNFKKMFPFNTGYRCSVLVVTVECAYRLVISENRVEVGKVTDYPVVIGSGATMAKVVWQLFPKASPLRIMSTLIAHDSSTGVGVDRFKYHGKSGKIRHYTPDELPTALKNLKAPK